MLGFILPPTVLISRPKDDAERLKKAILSTYPAAQIIMAPAISIISVPFERPSTIFDAVVMTSKHAIHAAVNIAPQTPAICVGDATARAARAAGLTALSAKGTAQDLLDLVRKSNVSKVLYLRGQYVQKNLESELNLAGIETESRIVYQQNANEFSAQALQDLSASPALLVPIYSARSALIVSQNLIDFKGEITVVAISKPAAQGWSGLKMDKIVYADAPNSRAMLVAIASQLT